MEKAKVIRRSVFFGMLAVIVALAVVLAVVLAGQSGSSSAKDLTVELSMIRMVNRQLQDILVPQLNGQNAAAFSDLDEEDREIAGTMTFQDARFFYNTTQQQRIQDVIGSANFRFADGKLSLEKLSTQGTGGKVAPEQISFYRSFLIPLQSFFLNNETGNPIDLSRLAVDEARLSETEYREGAIDRLNQFFGTNYTADGNWTSELNGRYAIVFSFEDRGLPHQKLEALSELDQVEGLEVTGIYYSCGNEQMTLCKPLRADDPINTSTLDPRESLRLLAARQDLVDTLLTSELYGYDRTKDFTPDFRRIAESFDELDQGRSSRKPIGACVVVDEGRFLTPEMVEAISKVCYRCIDVKLLAAV